MHETVTEVTARIAARSRDSRAAYLERMENARREGPQRGALSCANLAHGFAATNTEDKLRLRANAAVNIGIVSSYNDMLSAHQPLERFPALINRPRGKWAPRPSLRAGCPPCATASPRAAPAWS